MTSHSSDTSLKLVRGRVGAPPATIELVFSAGPPLTLEAMTFEHPELKEPLSTRRGPKVEGSGNGSFRWSSAVRGMTILLLQNKLAFLEGKEIVLLRGGAGSLASSFDYALSKRPTWLVEAFGADAEGTSLAKRLFPRSNPERKMGGDVIIGLGDDFEPRNIRIILDGRPLEDRASLVQHLRVLLGDPDLRRDKAPQNDRMETDLAGSPEFNSMGYHLNQTGTPTKPESNAPHLGEDYFQIFREEKSMRVALERASHVYGPQMDGQPLFLDSLSRISVVNPQGDAQVLATMTCANIGRERLYDIPQLFWFEFPREHLDLRVYDAETREPIPWRFTTDSPHKKVGFASIPGGIEPLTTRRLTFEYFAPEMFRFSSFYFTRIKPGLLEKSFHISILREEPLKDAFAYRLRPDDSVAPERPFVIVQRKKDRADIRWTIHYPEPKSLVKTFWAY